MSLDPSKQGPDSSDVLEETLGRLVRKAGVKAAILVDRKSGAILKMEGQIATIRTSLRTRGKNGAGDGSNLASDAGVGFDGGPKAGDMPEDETQGAREMAALVWKYVNVSDQLVSALDAEDDLKLLRLRTKKQELVISRGPGYILIVVHDTTPV